MYKIWNLRSTKDTQFKINSPLIPVAKSSYLETTITRSTRFTHKTLIHLFIHIIIHKQECLLAFHLRAIISQLLTP